MGALFFIHVASAGHAKDRCRSSIANGLPHAPTGYHCVVVTIHTDQGDSRKEVYVVVVDSALEIGSRVLAVCAGGRFDCPWVVVSVVRSEVTPFISLRR